MRINQNKRMKVKMDERLQHGSTPCASSPAFKACYNKETTHIKKEGEKYMFNFRIISCTDGTQVIDPSLKTPYSALTPVQMEEYMEMDAQIAVMERLKKRERREAGRKQGIRKNLLYRAACMFGLV